MSKVSRSKNTPLGTVSAPSDDLANDSAEKSSGADSFFQDSQNKLNAASHRMIKSAIKLFGDNVVLPASLTDPDNPANDANYARLFAAVLGLDDLEKHFYTLSGQEQDDYLDHKKAQREAKWKLLEKEKAEKKRLKYLAKQGKSPEDEDGEA